MKKIGFIGMGHMASAILKGIIKSGYINGEDVIVYDIQESQIQKVKHLGVEVATNEEDVVVQSEYILIAVKPQVVEKVIKTLKDVLKNKCLISIALGYDFEKYQQLLDSSTRHVFVMPNTPVQVLEGMCLIEDKHSLTDHEFVFVKKMFASLGDVEMIPSHLMGVAGSLSGCGPAFLYMVIEALGDGAVAQGLPRDIAYKLASQMVLGAGKMQKETSLHPGILKDQVCSPSGSTIRGVQTLEKYKIRSAFIEAMENSTKKS